MSLQVHFTKDLKIENLKTMQKQEEAALNSKMQLDARNEIYSDKKRNVEEKFTKIIENTKQESLYHRITRHLPEDDPETKDKIITLLSGISISVKVNGLSNQGFSKTPLPESHETTICFGSRKMKGNATFTYDRETVLKVRNQRYGFSANTTAVIKRDTAQTEAHVNKNNSKVKNIRKEKVKELLEILLPEPQKPSVEIDVTTYFKDKEATVDDFSKEAKEKIGAFVKQKKAYNKEKKVLKNIVNELLNITLEDLANIPETVNGFSDMASYQLNIKGNQRSIDDTLIGGLTLGCLLIEDSIIEMPTVMEIRSAAEENNEQVFRR